MDENPFESLTDRELEIITKFAFLRLEREARKLGIDTSDPDWNTKDYPPEIKARLPHLSLEEVGCLLEKTKRDIQKISDELNPPIDLVPDDDL